MVSFTRMTVIVLVEGAVFFGAGYLYRFAWKRRSLKSGTLSEREKYAREFRDYRNRSILIGLGTYALLSLLETKVHATEVATWLLSVLGTGFAQGVIALAVLILGFTASYFRKTHRVGYGLIEITFGIVGAVTAAGHVVSADALFPAAITLVGCVYIVARGNTNIEAAN